MEMETNRNRMYLRTYFFILLITAFTGICLTCCNIDTANGYDLAKLGKKLGNKIKDGVHSTIQEAQNIIGETRRDKNQPEFPQSSTNEDVNEEKLTKECKGGGAASGALIGYAIGKEDGAALGVVLGRQVGEMYADGLIQEEKELRDQEDTLEESVKVTTRINQETKESNDDLNEKINALQDDSVNIDNNIEQGIVVQKELNKRKEEVEYALADTNELLKTAKTRLRDMKEKLEKVKKTQGAEFVKLEEQIKVLENEIVELEQSVDELTAIDQKYGA